MTKHEKQLWARYRRSRSIPDRNALVEHYYPDLERICRGRRPRSVGVSARIASRVRSLTEDDIANAALVLMRCVEGYSAASGCGFRTFLYRGVQQGVVNTSRHVRVGEMGTSLDSCNTVELPKDLVAPEVEPTIEREEEMRRMCAIVMKSKRHVDAIIATFRPQERRVLQFMLFEGMNNGEVARKMRVTPGRVSQLKKSALEKLGRVLGTRGK